MKKILVLCLVAAVMLVSGCNVIRKSDADSNGNAMSSIYKERVEDGKTVGNNASVPVGNREASDGIENIFSFRSADGLSYMVEDADLRKGEAELNGYFVNSGSNPIKVDTVHLAVEFHDEEGKSIWKDEKEFKNLKLVVKPKEKKKHDFIITNPNAPAFDGDFDLRYEMDHSS